MRARSFLPFLWLDVYKRQVLTGSMAVVDQEVTLFEDTIAGNIRMWDASIEDFEVILAARDAQLHEDIICLLYPSLWPFFSPFWGLI